MRLRGPQGKVLQIAMVDRKSRLTAQLRARADATARPAKTADGGRLVAGRPRWEESVFVIARRTAAQGASSARRTVLPLAWMPSGVHITARSKSTGLSFHCGWR